MQSTLGGKPCLLWTTGKNVVLHPRRVFDVVAVLELWHDAAAKSSNGEEVPAGVGPAPQIVSSNVMPLLLASSRRYAPLPQD